MVKTGLRKSLLSESQKKVALIIFEVFLFILAFFFLLPVFLVVLNSFKNDTEIQINTLALPRLYKSIPSKIDKEDFEIKVLNFLKNDEEREYVKRCYILRDEKRYYLKKDLSKNEKEKLKEILYSSNIFSTLWHNIYKNYSGAWNFGNTPVRINNKIIKNFVTFPRVFFNTLIITVFSVVGIVITSAMAAYALVRNEYRLSWIIFLLFTFSMVVPFQSIMVPLVETAKGLGLNNTLWGLILIYIGLGSPMAIFMYHGFIKAIPKELEESAAIDGAGPFTIFFRIVFPLLTPITATIVILNVLWIWNDFLLPLIILQSKELRTIQLAQYSFFGAYSKEYGLALASLVTSAAPIIIFYLIMQKYIIKGITSGAVKG
ncbi:MAG TPA: carbohydrate ABC transporter permease [Spirochaetota bacterium]|nr:carbohydrate ABC transporter permease [Spirochaetota bacterium]HOL57775.1 carbohydrate ABC transporter permease [Spirochaetota bacterium]HPP05310.1 carbohydrate ABC transporter permease [Spirochaetota bacterium]